jgi:nicotinamide phosphoribosyltransferase
MWRKNMRKNLILCGDSYAMSHFNQYPPGMTRLVAYLESRGGIFPTTTFFGLQAILKQYLMRPITFADIIEAKEFAAGHGEPFNEEGWTRVVTKHDGFAPLKIRAVPEGMTVPNHNVLMTVESTDPELAWMVSYWEALLVRVWYPTTICTNSRESRKIILKALQETADDPSASIDFALHDFGARGVSSGETAEYGGGAHLVNFKGSDTMEAMLFHREYYHEKMAGYSIPAMQHSTVTAWGKENEVGAYRNMLAKYGKKGGIFAAVSDSFSIFNAIDQLWGTELRDAVIASGATLVVRPDSGNPPEIVVKCLQHLDAKFGSTVNSKGFRVLKYVKVIQGDGVDHAMIRVICAAVKAAGYSMSNVAFGSGGGLLQAFTRDSLKFAFKASEATVDHARVPVFKDPITDPGKKSKSGNLELVHNVLNGIATIRREDVAETDELLMRTVFENGKLLIDEPLSLIRERAQKIE